MDCRVIIKTHFGPIIIAIYSILFVLMPVAGEKKNQKYKLTKAMAEKCETEKKLQITIEFFSCGGGDT